MRIAVSEDVAAPVAAVFAALTDAAAFERGAVRRGARVRRLDGLPALGPGASWRVTASRRGREREAVVEVARLDPPTGAAARAHGGGFHGVVAADLAALSPTSTRVTLTVEVEARSVLARVVLGSLRLARGRLEARAMRRLSAWARRLEARRLEARR